MPCKAGMSESSENDFPGQEGRNENFGVEGSNHSAETSSNQQCINTDAGSDHRRDVATGNRGANRFDIVHGWFSQAENDGS